jgi:hypothetical protein
LIFTNGYAQSVEFQCALSGENWILTNVCAPCTLEGKQEFLSWFKGINTPDEVKWLIVGDFNLIRCPANRNKTGSNIQEMLKFNESISRLRITEIPLRKTGLVRLLQCLDHTLPKYFGSISLQGHLRSHSMCHHSLN